MPRFNVGDRVRCIDPGNERLVEGRIYTITNVDSRILVGWKEIDGTEAEGISLARRFVLEPELPTTTVWVFIYRATLGNFGHTETYKTARFTESTAQDCKAYLQGRRDVVDLISKKMTIKLTEAYRDA